MCIPSESIRGIDEAETLFELLSFILNGLSADVHVYFCCQMPELIQYSRGVSVSYNSTFVRMVELLPHRRSVLPALIL